MSCDKPGHLANASFCRLSCSKAPMEIHKKLIPALIIINQRQKVLYLKYLHICLTPTAKLIHWLHLSVQPKNLELVCKISFYGTLSHPNALNVLHHHLIQPYTSFPCVSKTPMSKERHCPQHISPSWNSSPLFSSLSSAVNSS